MLWATQCLPHAHWRRLCTAAQPLALEALSDAQLGEVLGALGHGQAYRVKQLRRAFADGVYDVRDVTTLPAGLREALAPRAPPLFTVQQEQVSKDGTVKHGLELRDGHMVEAVLMPYRRRYTACVSTQAGCAMGCTFCATGSMGFRRQLSADEIVGQAAAFAGRLKAQGGRLSNVVFMGMGEPLMNYRNVVRALTRIHDELNVGYRHITVSTVGVAPRILDLAQLRLPITLAVSLHAVTDAARSQTVPANSRWPLRQLVAALRVFQRDVGRRISFEWTLIRHVNDDAATADALADFVNSSGLRAHVNVIPLNPTPEFVGRPSDTDAVTHFVGKLHAKGVSASVRMRRGIDIDAGCGQLAERLGQAHGGMGGSAGAVNGL